MSTNPGPALRAPQWFGGAFGMLLGLALLKFGNPIILDRLIAAPRDGLEFIIQPWPLRWGYVLLVGCLLAGLGSLCLHRRAPKLVILLPVVWLGWQALSATQTIDARLTGATLIHFGACVVCFFLGLFCLGGRAENRLFWLLLLASFSWVLWSGFEQHYGGLQATREMFYQQPDWQNLPQEYLKKIQSDRIFSTLVYPNALAAAILLLLPPMLLVAWDLTAPLSRLPRAVLVGLLAYGALACLAWSGSKSGWLIALVLGLVALFRLNLPKVVRTSIWILLLLAGLAGFFVKYASYFRRGAPSVSARFEYWKAAVRTGIENPVLGTGPGTFSVAYRRIKPAGAEMAQLAHNDYLEQFCDSGIPGAASFAGFVIGSVLLLPARRRIFNEPHFFAVWLGLLGWMLQGFVEFLLYIPALAWLAFALLGWLWAHAPEPIMKSTGPTGLASLD